MPSVASAVLPSARSRGADALALVGLDALMERTEGRPEIVVGIVDGPIAPHRDLAAVRVLARANSDGGCSDPASPACAHGTFVAGILAARRGSPAPAICPCCSFVARPLFGRSDTALPVATPGELARATIDCVDAGARIVNLSAATGAPSPNEDRELGEALDYALARGAVVVAAAGNQRRVGGSPITRHPAVLPVAACDRAGRPLESSNLGRSIGLRGLLAPGAGVTSLGAAGAAVTRSGTSVAAPFVTGVLALLCSLFPSVRVSDVARALTRALPRRASVIPPLLDARAAFDVLATTDPRR